ncbi:MAG: hypothetical protein AB1564_02090 [Chloroflexota bacterium]
MVNEPSCCSISAAVNASLWAWDVEQDFDVRTVDVERYCTLLERAAETIAALYDDLLARRGTQSVRKLVGQVLARISASPEETVI